MFNINHKEAKWDGEWQAKVRKSACKAAMSSAASTVLCEFPAKIVVSAPGPVFTGRVPDDPQATPNDHMEIACRIGSFQLPRLSERLGTTRNSNIRCLFWTFQFISVQVNFFITVPY